MSIPAEEPDAVHAEVLDDFILVRLHEQDDMVSVFGRADPGTNVTGP
ncbi:hypothetical protein [Pelobacter propionicus]|nr:hypothetical protein [Pelobacter propionicus]